MLGLNKQSPAYRLGDKKNIKTIILLSAPGSAEEKEGRPAAGETGKTLQIALEKLHKEAVEFFPSPNLDDYSIANAIETIHFEAKTGRTEATDSEIRENENITRIKNILSDFNTVIALGNKALLAIQTAHYIGVVFTAKHPSLQSLNQYYQSELDTSKERRIDRINQWAEDLVNSK